MKARAITAKMHVAHTRTNVLRSLRGLESQRTPASLRYYQLGFEYEHFDVVCG
jgi:hypothetical protein